MKITTITVNKQCILQYIIFDVIINVMTVNFQFNIHSIKYAIESSRQAINPQQIKPRTLTTSPNKRKAFIKVRKY